MVNLDKKWTTIGTVAFAALLSSTAVGAVFGPHSKSLQTDIKRQAQILNEEKALLARKSALQAEWEEKKNFLSQGSEPEAVLNAWVKDLLALAQSQALNLEKLEPAGIKTGPDGKKLTVFISFQGDIQKFIRFVYQLMDKDALTEIESCDLRLEEGQAALTVELMLGKTLK